jgi:Dyp-type peroxidase family protein
VPTPVTRRGFLRQSAGAALGAAGLYELVDAVAGQPARAAAAVGPRPHFSEQHLLRDVRVLTDNGVEILAPPLHHQLVTAKLRVGRTKSALREAQRELERALLELDSRFAPTPAGLGLTIGWGLPYFRRYVQQPWRRHAPHDLRANAPALLDAIRFPSDPGSAILEQNDLMVQLRSDRLDHIAAAAKLIFDRLGETLEVTSIRKGFVGGGYDGGRSLPKHMATKAGIAGASRIPESAQLFLGFTSSQRHALGPGVIANFESLPGLTDQWPNGYFRNGTTMHVSHVYLDLELWYEEFTFDDRVWATFRPAVDVPAGTQTVPQGAHEVVGVQAVLDEVAGHGFTGHSAAMQPATRLDVETVDNYGNRYPKGTAVIQRPDFNTLDSPFAWSARPTRDRVLPHPSAGLHFVGYSPTSDTFHRVRLAMDGRYADGTIVPTDPTVPNRGFNSVLKTTHRQNFLVPPRRHRSFPLVELL